MSVSRVFKNPWLFFAFVGGVGLSPIAPGTMGTLSAFLLYILLAHWLSFIPLLILGLFLLLVGVMICGQANNLLQQHDHSGIVWDEMSSFFMVLVIIPSSWTLQIFGFILFRLFDILKPPPIIWFDKEIKGGKGIMLDDIVAALFTVILVWGCVYADYFMGTNLF